MDPLHQFNILTLIPLDLGPADVSFTNSALFMLLSASLVLGFMMIGTWHLLRIPNRMQAAVEMLYEFVEQMVGANAGVEARRFTPLVFALFTFILCGNLIGMIPGAFTFTSHVAITGALALMVFALVTVLGLVSHGWRFFARFAPSGVPAALMPLMIPLEIISYFIRPLSLSVRLFANMMAGHAMLKVFASFIIMLSAGLGVIGWVLGVLPLMLLVVLTGFEIFVAFIQAYVFALLTVVYIQDALVGQH